MRFGVILPSPRGYPTAGRPSAMTSYSRFRYQLKMGDATQFATSLGYSHAYDASLSERHGNRESMAFVGGNDTAGNFTITFNARPNFEVIQRKQENDNPYYPHLKLDQVSHMDAHKGLLGFKILGEHPELQSDMGYGWSMNYDEVTYIDNLNGMLRREANEDELATLASRIRVMGLVEHDVLAEPHRQAGDPLSNNLVVSGKKTMPNTGPLMIRAGQRVMWGIPTVENGAIKGSSTDSIKMYEKGLAPLLTLPYVPSAHKGSPQMIFNSLQSGGMPGGYIGKHDAKGIFQDSVDILDSIKMIFVIVTAAMEKSENRSVDEKSIETTLEKLKLGSTTDAFSTNLYKMLLRPEENWIFEKNPPTPSSMSLLGKNRAHVSYGPVDKPRSNISGRANTGNVSVARDANMKQMNAFRGLYQSIATIENRFRDRIFGKAYTNAVKGRDMDVLLSMSSAGSL